MTTQSGVFVITSDLVGAERKADDTFMGTAFPGGSCVVGPTDDKKEQWNIFHIMVQIQKQQ